MPHILVKLYPGRSEQMKMDFSRKLVECTSEVLNAPIGAISVSIEEVPPDRWEETVVKPEMLDKPETLYIKPADLAKTK